MTNLPKEESDSPGGGQGKIQGRNNNARSDINSTYRSERVDPNDENWEKRMEEIIGKKIRKVAMKEKGLLNPNDVVIEPPFTKEIIEYLILGTLKLLALTLMMAPKTSLIVFRLSN